MALVIILLELREEEDDEVICSMDAAFTIKKAFMDHYVLSWVADVEMLMCAAYLCGLQQTFSIRSKFSIEQTTWGKVPY